MVLTEVGGSTALTAGGGETTLYDTGVVSVNNFAFSVFLNTLVSGDTLTIKVYKLDVTGGVTRVVYNFSYNGAQSSAPTCEIPYITATQFKVTATLTGTSHTVNWNRYNM